MKNGTCTVSVEVCSAIVPLNCTHTCSFSAEISVGITVVHSKGNGTGCCYGCGADLIQAGGAAGSMATMEKSSGF